MDGETAHSAQCSNSLALAKVIGLIIEIEYIEQKCVNIKGFLKS